MLGKISELAVERAILHINYSDAWQEEWYVTTLLVERLLILYMLSGGGEKRSTEQEQAKTAQTLPKNLWKHHQLPLIKNCAKLATHGGIP